jgi:hypothetical protein
MNEMKPLGTALAFALTAAIVYPLCALVFTFWPNAARVFVAALFHGMDLTMGQTASAAPGYGQVFLGFCGSLVIAFVLGLIYGWMNNLVWGLFFKSRPP